MPEGQRLQLHEYRLDKLEGAVETLSTAVDELKEFAISMKVHFKIGGALLVVAIGVLQPVVTKVLGG